MEVGSRPASLSGCWKTWEESDIDNVIRTEMDSGLLHTRRRFTGTAKRVIASVTLPRNLYQDFMSWFRVDQQQGAVATTVINPLGEEVIYQWVTPPKINWIDPNAFTATVEMYQGSWF